MRSLLIMALAASVASVAAVATPQTTDNRFTLPLCTARCTSRAVVLLIDVSSSMRTNDPSRARVQLASDLIDTLTTTEEADNDERRNTRTCPADRVAIITFNDKQRVLYALGNPDQRAKAALTRVRTEGSTDGAGAIRAAVQHLQTRNNATNVFHRAPVIVMITDNDKPAGLPPRINAAALAGIRMHWVQIGRRSDILPTGAAAGPLLRVQEAVLATGGAFAISQSARQVLDFARVVVARGIAAGDDTGAGSSPNAPLPLPNGLAVGIQAGAFAQRDPVAAGFRAPPGSKVTVRMLNRAGDRRDAIAYSVSWRPRLALRGGRVGEPGQVIHRGTVAGGSSATVDVTFPATAAAARWRYDGVVVQVGASGRANSVLALLSASAANVTGNASPLESLGTLRCRRQ